MPDNNCQINGRSVFSSDTVGEVVMYVGPDPRYIGGSCEITGYDAVTRTYNITLLREPAVQFDGVPLREIRFLNERVPTGETPVETGLGEPVDADQDAAQLAALSTGQGNAIAAAGYWAELADTLTTVRADAAGHLPQTPYGYDEWYDTRALPLPFKLGALRKQLADLSGLITKAHTIAALYTAEAARLDDEYAAVAPD